ncbi:hypothetical protein KGA66_15885 [Actinocrinis puniceicyclus]|uniref:Membrane-associated oxidoreductase n=1 Tax=Actinocrinis puniceicyclus TaxID=977794 RepID=A0A8J8BBY2_9ACTN|nr:hypothetical protein [Actinocrinis puniceicyclus]MBS2964537.1 hypothetical protein [Actinocrinis puniceicyclus]
MSAGADGGWDNATVEAPGDDVPDWLPPLSRAERRLWDAFPYGATVEYLSGDPDLDDPARAARWGEERTIRAAVIAALALGARRPVPGRTAGVRIIGARVVGQIDLRHGQIEVPLTLRRCRIEDTLRLDEAVAKSIDLTGSHTGRIMAEGAHVRGSLKLNDVRVVGGPDFALHLDEITVDTDLAARALHCDGPLCLIGARIGAVLDLIRCTVHYPGKIAVNLGGAQIGRSLLFGYAHIRGQLRMPGAQVDGMALFSGTEITDAAAAHGIALEGENFTTGGDGLFDKGFRAEGQVALIGANFGGVLSFRDAHLVSVGSSAALHCGGMQVARGLYLTHGFHAEGEVRLVGVRIGGHLDLVGMAPNRGPITLYHAAAATIRDGGPETWPQEVLLDGLTYNAFDPYLPGRERLALLRRQHGGYRAQPYEFMAAYYRALGHEEDARAVLIEKERVRRTDGRRWDRFVGMMFGTLVGYGYRPMRAVLFSILIQLAAIGYFTVDRPTQIRPDEHVVYYPALYAADLFVPIVHFGQVDAFQSHGFAAVVAWGLPYLGWAFGIAIVAGASRALARGGSGLPG